MSRLMLVVLALAWLVADPAAAQPPRDPARLPAAAGLTISGRVTAADGETALRRALVRMTSPELPRERSTRTDAKGRYEFSDLPHAGTFTLTASKPQYLQLEYGQRRPFEPGRKVVLAGKSLTSVDFLLPRAGVISGTAFDPSGDPVDQLWVMAFKRSYVDGRLKLRLVKLTVSNDVGQYRLAGLAPGDYFVAARERGQAPTEFTDEPLGYAAVYFPGAADPRQAQPVRVAVGQAIMNLDLQVPLVRTSTLTGRLVQADGRPPLPMTRVSLLDGDDNGPAGNVIGGATAKEDGSFRIAGVRPGSYVLSSQHPQQGYGALPIDVVESDISGLTLVIGQGAKAAGRVITSAGLAPSFPTAAMDVQARVVGNPSHFRGHMNGRLNPDWWIEWIGLVGTRLFRTPRLPAGWWLKAVMRGDRDVTDEVIQLEHGQAIKDLTIVLDENPTRIAGAARDAKGAAVIDYTVLVFAADGRRWTAESRFIRAVRPDHAGRYVVSGLPPERYLAIAVDFVEDGQWLDPQYLESLRSRARPITLEAGQKIEIELTLVGG